MRLQAIEVGQQEDGSLVAGIGRHQFRGRVNGFLLVVGLLVILHQRLQRGHLHHAVGILRHEGLKAADLRRRVLLLDRTHVSVVLGRVFDNRGLSRRSRLGRCCLPLWWLRRLGGILGRCQCSQPKHNRNQNLFHQCMAPWPLGIEILGSNMP